MLDTFFLDQEGQVAFPPQVYEPAYKYESQLIQPIQRSFPDLLNAQHAPQSRQQGDQHTTEPQ